MALKQPGRGRRTGTVKAVGKSVAQKQAEKIVKSVAKQVKNTGRLRSPKTGRWIQKTQRNVKSVLTQLTRETTQQKRTTKAALKLVDSIIDLFKPSKKATKKVAPPSKKVATPPKKATKKVAPPSKKVAPPSKKATKKVVTPPTKKPNVSARQRVYEMIDLPESFNNDTLNSTLEELEENADGYDSLLKNGEGWGARIGVGKRSGYTYEFFSNFDLLLKKLSEYRFTQKFGDDPAAKNDLVGMIKVIRFKGPGKNPSFVDSRRAWNTRKQLELGRAVGRKLERTRKSKEKSKVIKAQEQTIKEQKKLQDELNRAQRMHSAQLKQERELRLMEEGRRKALEAKLAKLERENVSTQQKQAKKRVPKKGKKK